MEQVESAWRVTAVIARLIECDCEPGNPTTWQRRDGVWPLLMPTGKKSRIGSIETDDLRCEWHRLDCSRYRAVNALRHGADA